MNTTQKLARLKELDKSDRDGIYERLKLANEVMLDTDWIEQSFHGSDIQAMDYLEVSFFSVLAGTYTLGAMLSMFRKYPDRESWSRYKYNINAMMIAMREDEKESREPRQAVNWKKLYEELREEVTKLRVQNAELRAELAEAKSLARVA